VTWLVVGLVAVAVLLWPVLHGALLAEGVRVLTGRRAPLGALLLAVLAVPWLVAGAQLVLGCVTGAVAAFTPLAVGSWLLSVAIGVAVRAWGYASVLQVPPRGAVGLAVGVTVVNLVYGGVLVAVVGGTWWAASLLSSG
jgi:hypothetical protein